MYPILLVASLLLFLFVTIVYLRQDFASVFHPITLYLAFHGFVFVLRPFFAWYEHYDTIYRAFQFMPSPASKAAVIVCANLGLLAFVGGAWRSGHEPLIFRQGLAELAHRRQLVRPFLAMAAVLAPLAVLSLWSAFTATEWTMRMDRGTGISVNTSANGWFTDAQMLLVPLAVLVAWTFRFRWWALLPLIAFIILRAGTGGRGAFVVACIAAGMLWLYDSRRRWPSPRLFALVLALAGAFYFVGQDRGVAIRSLLQDGTVVEVRAKSGFMESMDFANMEFFEYLTETIPRKSGSYGYFLDNLQLFTEPIPRVLWPGKPVGAPIKLYNLVDYGTPIGMTNSLPGEGWAQAGYFGVVLWCGLWGLVLGSVYSRFARGRQGNFDVALYFAFLPIFVVAYRDGLLLTIARTGVFYLAPVLAWALAAKAMNIADPSRLPLRGRRQAVSATPVIEPRVVPPPRSRRPEGGPIVPRAWRRRGGTQPAE